MDSRQALSEKLDELFDRAGERPEPFFVLDVGCGDGYASAVVAERLRHRFGGRRGRLIGLDREPQAVGQARRRATPGTAALLPVLGDAYRMPFADCRFAFIVALNIFHGIDRGPFAAELWRVLAPQGRVLLWDRIPEVLKVPRFAVILDRAKLGLLRALPARLDAPAISAAASVGPRRHS